MSFSGEAKSELCRAALQRQCCARAEAHGVLLFCNTFQRDKIRIVTENRAFAAGSPSCFTKPSGLRLTVCRRGAKKGPN